MRYCPICFDEYEEEELTCAYCEARLIEFEALKNTPEFQRSRGLQIHRFVKAGSAENPFESAALSEALSAEHIPVFAKPQRGSLVDPLTTGTTHGWWDIMVPEEQLERARPLIDQRRADLRATEGEAAAAAAEEELEGERVFTSTL
jgi:hypothetical protein